MGHRCKISNKEMQTSSKKVRTVEVWLWEAYEKCEQCYACLGTADRRRAQWKAPWRRARLGKNAEGVLEKKTGPQYILIRIQP